MNNSILGDLGEDFVGIYMRGEWVYEMVLTKGISTQYEPNINAYCLAYWVTYANFSKLQSFEVLSLRNELMR